MVTGQESVIGTRNRDLVMVMKLLQRRMVRLGVAGGVLVWSIHLLARVNELPGHAAWVVAAAQILVFVPAAAIVAELGAFARPLFVWALFRPQGNHTGPVIDNSQSSVG